MGWVPDWDIVYDLGLSREHWAGAKKRRDSTWGDVDGRKAQDKGDDASETVFEGKL